MSKPVFTCAIVSPIVTGEGETLGHSTRTLGVFLAASPALSFAADYLGGDTSATISVEHGDRSYHQMSPRTLKALSTGMEQGQVREFRVMLAQDSDELTAARVALRKAQDAIAALPSALPEEIVHGMLQPLQDAVTALEDLSDDDDGARFVITAHAPMRRAYGTVAADAEEPEASEEPAPESASERAASFRASVGLK